MAFIVKKTINGREYFYLNKSVRQGKKVISKTIAYLGKNKVSAQIKAMNWENIKKPESQKPIMEEPKKEIDQAHRAQNVITIDEIATFCKRKGFVYPSGEIYGGLSGFWDFGPLGVELKNNIKQDWWNHHVRQREDMAGIDGSIITNPKVWEASGHVSCFSDIAVVCKRCGFKTKIDKSELGKVKCEKCKKGDYENKGDFNLMFTTHVGPIAEESIKSYLRPETAQLIFTNFKFVQNNARLHLPFGIAQIGKAFRNEIAPRDFIFRCREFEQMEIEYFINPKEKCPYNIGNSEILVYSAEMQEKNQEAKRMNIKDAFKNDIIKTDWHAYWIEQELLWFTNLGANPSKFRIRQHLKDEKSHYALDTWDLQYEFPFGWSELQGMANRTDFDLKQHEKFSKTDMSIIEEKDGKPEKILPHVVCEPSQGVERAFLLFMVDAYTFDSKRNNIVLKLHPRLAPIKAAVFPIVKKPEYETMSDDIVKNLKQEFNVIADVSGSIGRRYSRNDEAGTPFCITIDEESPKKKDVTIRDRDTTKQIRVKIADLKDVLRKLISKEIAFEKAGKLVETRVKEN